MKSDWFKPGDKVKCVNIGKITQFPQSSPNDWLIPDKIYTVIIQDGFKNVRLVDVPGGVYPQRFILFNKEDNIKNILKQVDEADIH